MISPHKNLATEEYILRNYDFTEKDGVFIYVNTPCVVLGRNQNVYQEVDLAYCKLNEIDICRRVSGGGTVYHDLGNINIAIFTTHHSSKVNQYGYFMKPIFDFFSLYGISLNLNHRNSIVLNEIKIGGNAQYTTLRNMISHCTILYDANLTHLNNSLKTPFKQIQSNATPSVPSKVLNLKELNIFQDCNHLLHLLKQYFEANSSYQLLFMPQNLEEITNPYVSRYNSYDWIYGRSPSCIINHNSNQIKIEKGYIVQSTNPLWLGKKLLPDIVYNFF